MALWRIEVDGAARLAAGPAMQGPTVLLRADMRISSLLAADGRAFLDEAAQVSGDRAPANARVLAPAGPFFSSFPGVLPQFFVFGGIARWTG